MSVRSLLLLMTEQSSFALRNLYLRLSMSSSSLLPCTNKPNPSDLFLFLFYILLPFFGSLPSFFTCWFSLHSVYLNPSFLFLDSSSLHSLRYNNNNNKCIIVCTKWWEKSGLSYTLVFTGSINNITEIILW